MDSWTDSTLTSLNSWIGWFGVVSTFAGVLMTVLGIEISKEISRRDGLLDEARERKLSALEEAAKPLPLDQRLRNLLNSFGAGDFKILEKFAASKETSGVIRAELTILEDAELRRLCAEPGAEEFIALLPMEKEDMVINMKDTGAVVKQVRFRLNKAILPPPKPAPQ